MRSLQVTCTHGLGGRSWVQSFCMAYVEAHAWPAMVAAPPTSVFKGLNDRAGIYLIDSETWKWPTQKFWATNIPHLAAIRLRQQLIGCTLGGTNIWPRKPWNAVESMDSSPIIQHRPIGSSAGETFHLSRQAAVVMPKRSSKASHQRQGEPTAPKNAGTIAFGEAIIYVMSVSTVQTVSCSLCCDDMWWLFLWTFTHIYVTLPAF